MREPSFQFLFPPRVRAFGPWNVLMLITSLVTLAIWTTFVTDLHRPFRFDDTSIFATNVSIMTQAVEPVWPRNHRVARTLRVVSVAAFIFGLAGAIYGTWLWLR